MGRAGNQIMKSWQFWDQTMLALKKTFFLCVLSGLALSTPAGLTMLEASSSRDIHINTQPPFFSPNQLTISVGTPLTWNNRTHEPHTIVSDDCRSRTTCSFDSGFLGPNARYTLPQLKPGHYPYHCGIHPFMRGLLTIHPLQSFSSSSSDI
jgi:plastocyanin